MKSIDIREDDTNQEKSFNFKAELDILKDGEIKETVIQSGHARFSEDGKIEYFTLGTDGLNKLQDISLADD